MNQRSTFGRGLGLVEVLLVIAMCWVLAACLFTWRASAREWNAKQTCMNNLRQIGVGCAMYSGDYDNYYPPVRAAGATVSRPMKSLSLLFDMYVDNKKIFVCPATADDCRDLRPGQSFQPHGSRTAEGDRRQCSYAYDDTRGPNTRSNIVIAGDAPAIENPRGAPTGRNSDNHFGEGQNVLMYGGNRVVWITNTKNPEIADDDIYATANPQNPGDKDSYIHQDEVR